MNSTVQLTLVAAVIFLTHYQQGITGFGCTMLSLPFITLLLGLETAVPMLIMMGWLVALLIVIESRRHIVWREFAWIVIPVAVTMPIGIWLAKVLPGKELKVALATFAVIVGIEGLIKQYRQARPQREVTTKSRLLSGLFLPLGGVLQGAFGAGGPLVIIYATRVISDKTLFRVTLCMLWTALNPILIGLRMHSGEVLTPHIWKWTAFCLPFGLVGVWLGNRAHYRADIVVFRKLVYSVLIMSGLVLAWSVLH